MCVCMCMPPWDRLKPASPGQCLVFSRKICDKLRERVNSLPKFHAEMPSHIPSKKWMRARPDPASLCSATKNQSEQWCANSANLSRPPISLSTFCF